MRTGTVFLTPEEVQEIEETFKLFDADKSDNIDLNELNIAMKALGLSKTRKQVEEIMEVADRDGSGQIDIDEFKGLMASMIKERPVEAEFRKAFKRYDVEDMGMIDYDSLYTAAHKLEDEAKAKKDKHFEPVNDLEIRWMLKLADRSGKGLNQVTFEDFLEIMDKCGLISES